VVAVTGFPVGTADGGREWRVDGQRHRDDDLPAVERADGGREWWDRGMMHRLSGPAVEGPGGERGWWRDGCPVGDEVTLGLLERAYVADLSEADAWVLLGSGDLHTCGWVAAVVAANESPLLSEFVRVTAGLLIVDLRTDVSSGEWIVQFSPTGVPSWR
jgi:hypothetical protein